MSAFPANPITHLLLDRVVAALARALSSGALAVLAVIATASAAVLASIGTAQGLIWGASAYLLAAVFDCGVKAAAQRSGTPARFWPPLRALLDGAALVALGMTAARSGDNRYLWIAALAGVVAFATAVALLRRDTTPVAAPETMMARLVAATPRVIDRPTAALALVIGALAAPVEALFAVTASMAMIWMALGATLSAPSSQRNARARLALLYLVGFGLLAFLVSRLEMGEVLAALQRVGPRAPLVLIAGPLIGAATATSLFILLERKVPWSRIFYVHFVGDAYNQILPLAGLGGEPYKIKLLAEQVPIERASHAIVLDRLLHLIPGPLVSALLLPVVALFVPMPHGQAVTMFVAAGVMALLAAVELFVTFSRMPGRVTTYVTTKLVGAVQPAQNVPRTRLLGGLLAKTWGAVAVMVEIWILFAVLDVSPSPIEIATVATAVLVGAIMFFVVPQQIGINEAGIAAAFTLLGYPLPLAAAFAILRRSRQVFWALAGLAVNLVVLLFRRDTAQVGP